MSATLILTITSTLIGIVVGIITIIVQLKKLKKDAEEEKKTKAEEERKKDERILTMLDNDKKRLDKLDGIIERIDESTDIQGDMIYAMLSHMATNNNTGGMQKALDKYNAFYRKNH